MGSDSFSAPIFSALLEHGQFLPVPVEAVAVVTQPDRPAGRGRKQSPGPVKLLAERDGLQVLQPEKIRSAGAVDEILALRPDVILVASYGQILPASLLEAPPGKALNLHPSLLPRYRGSSPVAAPILAGDSTTGTTLMLMSPRMDAGPILDQKVVPIEPEETAGELAARLAEKSAELLLADLPSWLSGEIRPRHQDESEATYTDRLSKADGAIDWHRPAVDIDRRVRAFTPWPGAYSTWNGRLISFLSVAPGKGNARPGLVQQSGRGEITVGTGNGLLAVRRLKPAGGRPMSTEDFLRGHPGIIGDVLGQ